MANLRETAQYYPELSVTYDRTNPKSVYGEPDPVTLAVLGKIKGRVLEVGAGDGRYTHPMLKQGLHVVASDVSVEALDVLREKAPKGNGQLETAVFNAFEPFPFENRSFDAVVSTAFLYLYPEKHIREFMEGAHQVLKDNGSLVVDFVTDRKRTDRDGREIKGAREVQYTTSQAMEVIWNVSDGLFGAPLEKTSRVDQNLLDTAGYRMQGTKASLLFEKAIHL